MITFTQALDATPLPVLLLSIICATMIILAALVVNSVNVRRFFR
jgi:hypothetical protein